MLQNPWKSSNIQSNPAVPHCYCILCAEVNKLSRMQNETKSHCTSYSPSQSRFSNLQHVIAVERCSCWAAHPSRTKGGEEGKTLREGSLPSTGGVGSSQVNQKDSAGADPAQGLLEPVLLFR